MKKYFFGIVFLGFLTGCGGSPLSRSQTLGKLRVIAVIADKPEVQPGTAVQISPVISFVNIGNSSLTHEAWGCLDPGIGVGAIPTCENSATKTELMASSSLSLSAPNYTESKSNLFSFTVPATFLASYDSVSRYNGVNYIVEYVVRSSDGQVSKAIKRIVVTEKSLSEWNSNPTLTSFLSTTGATLATLPSAKTGLFANFSAASKQAYTYKNSSGTLVSAVESLTVAWFVSKGSFDYDQTDSSAVNNLHPDGVSGSVVFVGVLRDNRGGQAVLVINL